MKSMVKVIFFVTLISLSIALCIIYYVDKTENNSELFKSVFGVEDKYLDVETIFLQFANGETVRASFTLNVSEVKNSDIEVLQEKQAVLVDEWIKLSANLEDHKWDKVSEEFLTSAKEFAKKFGYNVTDVYAIEYIAAGSI